MDGGDEMWRKAEPLEEKENEFEVYGRITVSFKYRLFREVTWSGATWKAHSPQLSTVNSIPLLRPRICGCPRTARSLGTRIPNRSGTRYGTSYLP